MEALKIDLKEATDPEKVAKLQNEIKAKQIARLKEMETNSSHLWEKLEKTGDKKSCEELLGQIEQLDKDIGNLIVEAQIVSGVKNRINGTCTETGYQSDLKDMIKDIIKEAPSPSGSEFTQEASESGEEE